MIELLIQAVPAFLLAMISGGMAIAYAHTARSAVTWKHPGELWPPIYNAIAFQLVALALAAYAGILA